MKTLEKILKKLIVPVTAFGLTFSPILYTPYSKTIAYAQSNRSLAKQHFDRAKNYEKNGKYGNALIEYLKAKKYGEFEDIINGQIRKVANKIKEDSHTAKSSIKIMPFDNDTNDTEIPGLVKESLNQYILKNENLELKLAQTQTDIIITGTIHAFNIEENEARMGKTVKYQEGTTKVVNPEYQRKAEDLQRKYGEYLTSKEQKKSSDTDAALTGAGGLISKDKGSLYLAGAKWLIGEIFTGSEEDKAKFEEAKRDLENTSYYIEEPVHGWYNYDEITITREGRLKLTLRLVDRNDRMLYNDTISKNATHKDLFRYENTYAGIDGDPLELPSKFEIKEGLINEAITSASDSLDDAIKSYNKKSTLSNARAKALANDYETATELYFKFLANENEVNEDIERAVRYINSRAGTDLSSKALLQLLK